MPAAALAPSRGLDDETVARWPAAVEAERSRIAPPDDFPTLPLLPSGRYVEPAFFALEREALFKRGWVYAGHTDQVPQAGCWFQTRATGVPVLVVRGDDGAVRAFHNTCRHRGAPVARGESGCAQNGTFVCGYHGWTYALDGSLKLVTDRRDFGAADLECRSLVPLRCETYGSFVFVCEVVLRRADWKDPGATDMPEMATATTIERDHNPSYSVFPNLILPINASGIPAVAIWPIDIARSRIEVLWFAPGWGVGPRPALWDKRIANFDRIVDEDVSFVEPIQASLQSPGFRGVPLNYQERRIYHWNEELDRCIGVERIPHHLRVTPVLGDAVERD